MCFGGSSASNRGSVSSSRSGTGRTSSRTRSAGRGSGANKNIRQFRQSAVSNVTTDLKMGLSTFGMNKADQAAKLSQMGYSPRAIDSYQARTAASAARRSERLASRGSGGDDRRPTSSVLSPAVARQALSQKSNVGLGTVFKGPPTPPSDAAAAKSAPVTVGGAPELVTVGQTSAASGEMDAAAIEATAEGAAEKNVAETARKGRRSTIQTGAQGLLTTARTRRRRSLIGGGEPTGLIT